MTAEENLARYGLKLPTVSSPGGSYVSVNIRGHIAYIAIQFPILNEAYLFQGRLGDEVSTDQGYNAMQLCAMNVLAQVKYNIGFDNLIGLNHIDAYYRSVQDWDDAPKVVDGASELFLNILEQKGQHSRSIFGVHKLPRNFSVGLTATFTVNGTSNTS